MTATSDTTTTADTTTSTTTTTTTTRPSALAPPLTAVQTVDCRVGSASAKRQEILRTFHDTFTLYESLFDYVAESGHYAVADPLRHPLIFYLGMSLGVPVWGGWLSLGPNLSVHLYAAPLHV